jgi:lipopolysaccharide export system permease protein
MGSIGRYIFRASLAAFVMVLVSITTLMWITQALRNFDLMTNQGQTILVFIGITGLIIPMLIMIIAPIALMIAIGHVLTKLSTDSELIVMNSAGMGPWKVFRPFLVLGILVSIFVAWISFYLSPICLQELRRWATQVRAEIVSGNVQAGRFITIEGKMTLQIRERAQNGQLLGIMVDDQRDPKERGTIFAERGEVVTNDRGTFLVLENGAVHRQESGQRDPVIVRFTQYAFDLSRLSQSSSAVQFQVHELSMGQLINPPPDDPLFQRLPGHFRAELHNRITAPLYPLAFVFVTFVFLGTPRTTRQSRAMSLVGAVAVAMAVRGLGFVATIAGARSPIALLAPYVGLAAVFILGSWAISRGLIIEPPTFFTNLVNATAEGVLRRTSKAAGQTS